ncbi:MAG: DUF4178 domain-containing protein [Bacteroidota bacterium]
MNVPKGKALTVALTCKSCGVYFCPHSNINDKFSEKRDPAIPIGSRGTFEGKTYEVLGYVLKLEKKHRYKWSEYFLFSPYHGIAFLSEYGGNWNFLTPYANHLWLSDRKALQDPYAMGQAFKLYAKYNAAVLYAQGEFFNDTIAVTEDSKHWEHIAPPYILTFEQSNTVTGSFLGKYISPKDVASAFKMPAGKLPKKDGMGYTEPILGNFTPVALVAVSIVALMAAFVINIVFNNMTTEESVYQNTYTQLELKDSVKMISTPSFELQKTTAVSVQVTAPLDNDWFYAEYSLINEVTGEEQEFSGEISYYRGTDSDGSWSEGSKTTDMFLSSVPAGKYHLDIYPEFSGKNNYFHIAVYRNAAFSGNIWLLAIGLCVFPAIYFTYRHYKEVARWEDSDYSPYETDDD